MENGEKDKYARMLEKAEKNLDEFLEMPVKVIALEGRGEDAEEVVKDAIRSSRLYTVCLNISGYRAETFGLTNIL